jgi:hypothetical protein
VIDGFDEFEFGSLSLFPIADANASCAELKSVEGKFNSFSKIDCSTKLFMYPGTGRMTSNRFGRANPSLFFMLDKNIFGENDISISFVILQKLFV